MAWGVGYLGPVERLDDPPLPQDAGIPALGRRGGRDPHRAVELTALDLVDLVLRAARHVAVLDRFTFAGEPDVVHPGLELLDVDHTFPISSSRLSLIMSSTDRVSAPAERIVARRRGATPSQSE